MNPKGTAFIKQSIDIADCFVGGVMSDQEFYNQTRGKMVMVQDIAQNKQSILALLPQPTALADIPRKYVKKVYPFYKGSDGYLVCTEFNELQQLAFKGRLYIECPDRNPMMQIAILYDFSPDFWRREQVGEFDWE